VPREISALVNRARLWTASGVDDRQELRRRNDGTLASARPLSGLGRGADDDFPAKAMRQPCSDPSFDHLPEGRCRHSRGNFAVDDPMARCPAGEIVAIPSQARHQDPEQPPDQPAVDFGLDVVLERQETPQSLFGNHL